MIRSLVLFSLFVSFAACDSVTGPATAEVSVGKTYRATTFQLTDARTGDLQFDYLRHDAAFELAFANDSLFAARLFVPREALLASGETNDVDGDIDETVAGAYTQRDGALAFTPDGFSDTFLTDDGWTVSPGGGRIRYTTGDARSQLTVELRRR